MIDLKKEIAKSIAKLENIEIEKIEEYMEVPKEKNNEIIHFHVLNLQKN